MSGVCLCAVAVCADFIVLYVLDFASRHLSHEPRTSYDAYTLVGQWLGGVLRWACLFLLSHVYKNATGSVFRQWATVHCFISPVYETGRFALLGTSQIGKFEMWLVGSIAAALGCLFWEILLPDTKSKNNDETKQKARVLFMRVIYFYKPDFFILIGASVFLALAVLCKSLFHFLFEINSNTNSEQVLCLCVCVSGEMFIPLYTGKLIDILREEYQWNEFRSAIVLITVFSFGR